MQAYSHRWITIGLVICAALLSACIATPVQAAPQKQAFKVVGQYVEGCSCMGVCPCELTGLRNGCAGVGALNISSGSYNGVDLSGVKIAYATTPGNWVRLYVDAANPSQRAAASAFGSAVWSAFGKIEAVKTAKIAFAGAAGKYQVLVDGGKVMRFSSVPVLGGDGKTPISHSNTSDLLNPTFWQGRTVAASYHDGARSMSLKGTNSYFNSHVNRSGTV
jgi:hypothetical protein